jgi:hypothetical protein
MNTFEKQKTKEYELAWKIATNFEYTLSKFKEALTHYSPKEIVFPPIERVNSDTADFIITDLHI